MKLSEYRLIAAKVRNELTAVLAANGLTLTHMRVGIEEGAGTVRFTIDTADAKLKDKEGNAVSPDGLRFQRYGSLFRLKPEWLGTEVMYGGKTFKIAGMRETRSPKKVVLERDGKSYVCTPMDILKQLDPDTAKTMKENFPEFTR